MIVDTTWLHQRKFVSTCPSGYELEMDATEKYGGQGEGLTPMELVLAGIAGCIGIDVTMILSRYLEKINKLQIRTEGIRREELPTKFSQIKVTFDVEGEIESHRLWRAIRLAHQKYCAVSASLNAEIQHVLVLNGETIPEPEEDYSS
jgi:putative redox protein